MLRLRAISQVKQFKFQRRTGATPATQGDIPQTANHECRGLHLSPADFMRSCSLIVPDMLLLVICVDQSETPVDTAKARKAGTATRQFMLNRIVSRRIITLNTLHVSLGSLSARAGRSQYQGTAVPLVCN